MPFRPARSLKAPLSITVPMLPTTLIAVTMAALTVLAASPSQSQPPANAVNLPMLSVAAGRTWTGKWIWTDGEPSPKNSYVYFRKSLDLRSTPKEPKLHLTADSRYQVWVNGEFVGRGPARSDRRWLSYDSWDLGEKLKKGKNTVAVLVHHFGESTFQYMHGRGGLIAEITSGKASEERTLAGSEATWKAMRSAAWSAGQPRMSLQLGFNEIYDARKEPSGWRGAGFSEEAWPSAVVIGPAGMEPWPQLVPRDIPPMLEEIQFPGRVMETAEVTPAPLAIGAVAPPAAAGTAAAHISQAMAAGTRGQLRTCTVEKPEELVRLSTGGVKVRTQGAQRVSFLVDLGRETTGYPTFRVRGAKGGETLDLGYGEVLQLPDGAFVPQTGEPPLFATPDGGPAPIVAGGTKGAARLFPDRDGVHYADRYLCRPGAQTFQTFDKRAGRYLQIDVSNAPEGIVLDGVGLLFSTYPLEYRGAFACSDERLTRIWEIGRWTCQLNMEDAYTDCPWRERGQWSGDARIEALINHYSFGDTRLNRRALRLIAQSLTPDGITWGVYPTDWDGGRLPAFTLIWASQLWDTCQHTGDEEILKELFPRVRYTLDHFFSPKVGPRGLLKDVPYWGFIDLAPVDEKGEPGALNAYYYDALRSAARIARLISDPSAGEYETRAAAVRAAINSHLWDARQHVYRDSIRPDGTQSPTVSTQTNSLCVLFDIAPKEEHGRILDFIYDPANLAGSALRVVGSGTPYFGFYQLGALYHADRPAQALSMMREEWGRMLDWGATTWWEKWKPGGSFGHGASGAPTFYLPAMVTGVRPLKPGFAEVLIAPQWLDLTHASASVPTSRGEVKAAWQRDLKTGVAAVRVETPKDVPAEVVLPPADQKMEVRINRKAGLPEGVTRTDLPDGTTRFRLLRGGPLLLELTPQGK